MIVRTDIDQAARNDDGNDSDHVTLVQRTWTDIDMFRDGAVLRKRYPIKHFIVAPCRPMSRQLMVIVKASK
jgi:hypothetical protein